MCSSALPGRSRQRRLHCRSCSAAAQRAARYSCRAAERCYRAAQRRRQEMCQTPVAGADLQHADRPTLERQRFRALPAGTRELWFTRWRRRLAACRRYSTTEPARGHNCSLLSSNIAAGLCTMIYRPPQMPEGLLPDVNSQLFYELRSVHLVLAHPRPALQLAPDKCLPPAAVDAAAAHAAIRCHLLVQMEVCELSDCCCNLYQVRQ